MVLPKTETAIWLALKSAVSQIITNPVLPTFDPGAIVEPPASSAPFLLLSDVRNDKGRPFIGKGDAVQSGTLMLNVQWPLARPVDHTQLMELGATIAANFPADKCIQYGGVRIRVTRDSDALASYIDGIYRVVPVRVFWTTML